MYFPHLLILCCLSGSKYSSQHPVLRHCWCVCFLSCER